MYVNLIKFESSEYVFRIVPWFLELSVDNLFEHLLLRTILLPCEKKENMVIDDSMLSTIGCTILIYISAKN